MLENLSCKTDQCLFWKLNMFQILVNSKPLSHHIFTLFHQPDSLSTFQVQFSNLCRLATLATLPLWPLWPLPGHQLDLTSHKPSISPGIVFNQPSISFLVIGMGVNQEQAFKVLALTRVGGVGGWGLQICRSESGTQKANLANRVCLLQKNQLAKLRQMSQISMALVRKRWVQLTPSHSKIYLVASYLEIYSAACCVVRYFFLS